MPIHCPHTPPLDLSSSQVDTPVYRGAALSFFISRHNNYYTTLCSSLVLNIKRRRRTKNSIFLNLLSL